MRILLVAGLLAGCRQSMHPDSGPDKNPPGAWEQLLSIVVDSHGLVNYDLLEKNRQVLDSYVAWLGTDRPWSGKKDFHAQYLNAYNALVLYQVLERGRPGSVLDLHGLVPIKGFQFFHWTQFKIERDWLTLSEIENERLRWKELDYRDHAALNCASMSCPPLRNELYRPATLDQQLDDQFKHWMNDNDRGVRIVDDKAQFSPIFDWYARDFSFFTAGMDPCTLAASVMDDPARSATLYELADQGCPHTYFDYDWSLNDQKKAAR